MRRRLLAISLSLSACAAPADPTPSAPIAVSPAPVVQDTPGVAVPDEEASEMQLCAAYGIDAETCRQDAEAAASDLEFLAPPTGAMPCPTPVPAPRVVNGHTFDTLSCYMPNARTEVWAITLPDPSAAETDYPAIAVRAGDLVRFAAGGCVQTGGHGLTTYRYVRPVDAERAPTTQYFGSARLPGVFQATRLDTLISGAPISVLSDPGADAHLRLQYADDNYGDNSYDAFDSGHDEQCRKMEQAWVAIIIQHDCAAGAGAAGAAGDCSTAAPMDLVADARDDNGLPIAPEWGWQRLTGAEPAELQLCNWSQKHLWSSTEDASLCAPHSAGIDNAFLCQFVTTPGNIHGHVNFAPATYWGKINWGSHSKPIEDDDYSLHLEIADDAGVTDGSADIEVEFDSAEVVAHAKSAWWKRFAQVVALEDDKKSQPGGAPADLIDGKQTLVTGLVGLDCGHSCFTELHPAYAMAIHMKEDPQDDVWAFFVRNTGDEGFCGSVQHPVSFPGDRLVMRLPAPPGYQSATLVEGAGKTEIEASAADMSYQFASDGNSARITFQLEVPGKASLFDGELHLRWQ